MKILITGYPGFLGRNVARAMKADGHFVRVVMNRHTVTRATFAKEANDLIWGSVEDPETVRKAVAGMDAVLHCAWRFNKEATPRANSRNG